jgi:hypothetical protein
VVAAEIACSRPLGLAAPFPIGETGGVSQTELFLAIVGLIILEI